MRYFVVWEYFIDCTVCTRKVSCFILDIHSVEKAIQFIQAEKMFYETALIDTSQLQTKLGKFDENLICPSVAFYRLLLEVFLLPRDTVYVICFTHIYHEKTRNENENLKQ